jgi:dTDP-4-dehydrorhamnose reductase
MLRLAQQRPELKVVDDQMGSPTWARSLANATAELLGNVALLRKNPGIYHLTAAGYVSRFALAQKIFALGRDFDDGKSAWATLHPIATADYPLPAMRPPYAVLSNDKIGEVFGVKMSPWESALQSCLKELFSGPAHSG